MIAKPKQTMPPSVASVPKPITSAFKIPDPYPDSYLLQVAAYRVTRKLPVLPTLIILDLIPLYTLLFMLNVKAKIF